MRTMTVQEEISYRTKTIKSAFATALEKTIARSVAIDFIQTLVTITKINKEKDIQGILFTCETGEMTLQGEPIVNENDDVFFTELRLMFWDIDDVITESLSVSATTFRLMSSDVYFTFEIGHGDSNISQEVDIVIKR